MDAICCCKIESGSQSEEVISEVTIDTIPEASTVNRCQQDGAALVFREIFHGCSSLCNRFTAVNSSKLEFFQDESLLNQVKHLCPTGEDNTGLG